MYFFFFLVLALGVAWNAMQDMHSKREAQSQLEWSASIQSHISGEVHVRLR